MKQRRYLIQRGGTFSVRVMIPKDLRSIYGSQREIMRALGTSDRAVAEVRMHPVLHEVFSQFEAYRQRRTPLAKDVARAADEVFRLALEDDMCARNIVMTESAYDAERQGLFKRLPNGPDLDAALAALDERMGAAKRRGRWRHGWELALKKHLIQGEPVLVSDLANHILGREGYLLPADGPAYRDFCRELIKAQLKAIEVMKERDLGVFNEIPAAMPGASSPSSPVNNPTIAERLNLYLTENPGRVEPYILAQTKWVVGLFAQFVGSPGHISQITRTNVAEWRRALRSWPDRATQRKEFAGVSFNEIVARNADGRLKVIGEKTINRYLGGLAAFAKWLVSEAALPENPTSNMWIKICASSEHLGQMRG